MKQISIKNIQKHTLPRERLVNQGSENLSDTELMAIILKSAGADMDVISLSHFLIKKYSSLENIFGLDLQELTNNKYIGISKAVEIKAISEICKRIFFNKNTGVQTVNNPQDVYKLLQKDLYEKKQEYLYLISLDSRKKVISKDLLGMGTINEILVSPREILRKALLKDAVNIIIAHNHPSNDPTPSQEDVDITYKITEACKKVEITLLDHIIIANDSFFSIRSSNLIRKGGE